MMNVFQLPSTYAMFSDAGNTAVKRIVRDAVVRTKFSHRYVTGVRKQSPLKAYLSATHDLSKLSETFPEATDTAVMECVYNAIVNH